MRLSDDNGGLDRALFSAAPTALVVEDDGLVRATLVHMLRRIGFRTFEAMDARAAVAKLDAIDRLDLVLSDVVMPGGIYGWGLARIVRELRPAARVLLISGYAHEARHEDDEGPRRERLLSKPISLAELGEAIADAFELASEQPDDALLLSA